MCQVLHKCFFEIVGTNWHAILSYQLYSDYGINSTYLSVSRIGSPILSLELQPVFSFLLSLTLESNYSTTHHFNNHEFVRTWKMPDLPSSPVASKQSDSYALLVTPSPTKDCGSKRPSIDNESFSHDWKTSCTTPPTKVTDDPFVDDRKPSATLLVRIGDTKTPDKTLIPVTTNDSFRCKWK